MVKDVIVLCGFILLCFCTGGVSSYFMGDALQTWYPGLVKAPLSPPDALFAPAWSVLYLLMGVAVWMLWRKRETYDTFAIAIVMFGIQLFLNAMWTFCFFALQNPSLALVEIVGLDLALLLTIFRFFKLNKTAAILLFPYGLWLVFATYLNAYVVWAN